MFLKTQNTNIIFFCPTSKKGDVDVVMFKPVNPRVKLRAFKSPAKPLDNIHFG